MRPRPTIPLYPNWAPSAGGRVSIVTGPRVASLPDTIPALASVFCMWCVMVTFCYIEYILSHACHHSAQKHWRIVKKFSTNTNGTTRIHSMAVTLYTYRPEFHACLQHRHTTVVYGIQEWRWGGNFQPSSKRCRECCTCTWITLLWAQPAGLPSAQIRRFQRLIPLQQCVCAKAPDTSGHTETTMRMNANFAEQATRRIPAMATMQLSGQVYRLAGHARMSLCAWQRLTRTFCAMSANGSAMIALSHP